MNIQECLDYLCRFGHPMLWESDKGDWTCLLKVFVCGDGISFEVKYHRGETALDALQCCIRNLNEAMNSISKSAGTLSIK